MRRIRFDPTLCTGCQACQMACLDQRNINCAAGQAPLRYMTSTADDEKITWKAVGCVHCGACSEVCPSGALFRDRDSGYVLLEQSRCVGCGACSEVCPFHVISRDPETGHAVKCDGCYVRIGMGLLPACVHTCPTGALSLSD